MTPLIRVEICVINPGDSSVPLVLADEEQDEKDWLEEGWKYNFWMDFNPAIVTTSVERRFFAEALREMADKLVEAEDGVSEIQFMKK